MSRTSWLREPYLRWPVRATAVAVIAPGIVTLIAALIRDVPTEVAALLYIPAVVGAAAVGGPISGLGAALLSFTAMNYYVSRPLYSLGIDKTTDLIALVVFTIVALSIGMLLASVLASRARIERREMAARLLTQLSTRLLSGELVEEVLRRFATSAVEMFRLTRCEITTDMTAAPVAVNGLVHAANGSQPFKAPLLSKGREIGKIEVTPDARRGGALDQDDREMLRTFAGQMALALEGVRLSEEARRARLEAEANKLRATLYSSVTHDLRTPLSSITASVTSLMAGAEAFSAQSRMQHLETIKDEADRLNRIVTNLLDMSRMKTGSLEPKKTPTAIDEVIENVLARLKPLLKERPVTLDVEEDLPDVPMDVVQIDQVITNLVENAIKFSPPGSPIAIETGSDGDAIHVVVSDSGPGIPRHEQDRLFQPFERGDEQLGPGTGLGLAIARAIVEAHGGRIWVEASERGGLAVSFALPLEDTLEAVQLAGQ